MSTNFNILGEFYQLTLKNKENPQLLLLDNNTKAKNVLNPPLKTAGPMADRALTGRSENKKTNVDIYICFIYTTCTKLMF